MQKDELQTYLEKRFILFHETKKDNTGKKYFVASCYDREKKKQHNQVTSYNPDQLAILLRNEIVQGEIWAGKHLKRNW